MGKLRDFTIGAIAALGGAMLATQADAKTSSICGVTGANAVSLGTYNPFSPTGITNPSVSLTFTRNVASSGGGKTQEVNFYFTAPVGSPAYQLSDTTTGTGNLLYIAGGSHPTLTTTGSDAGADNLPFGGASASDTITRTFAVTVPPNVDLTAGLDIAFDIIYQCKGTGGFSDQSSDATLPGAISLHLVVVSALQAHYAGAALAFGDLTHVTTGGATTSAINNHITVKSSGPYNVSIASANNSVGKPFRMMWDSAHTGANDTIQYSVHFLSQTLDHTTTGLAGGFTQCQKATLTGVNLPIYATLQEGGSTKTPASYSDSLVVTITPQDIPPAGAPCSTL